MDTRTDKISLLMGGHSYAAFVSCQTEGLGFILQVGCMGSHPYLLIFSSAGPLVVKYSVCHGESFTTTS